MKDLKLKKSEVLVLKRIASNYTSHKGKFNFPKKGMLEAPDWNEKQSCGGGIHGLEWGAGDFDIGIYGKLFVVIRVNKNDGYIDLGDKVKFRKGEIIKIGNQKECLDIIQKYAPNNIKINYSHCTSNVSSQGYNSTSNQGDYCTSNQGDYSTNNQDNNSTSNQGDYCTSNQGYHSTSNQGYRSTNNQSDYSTSNQGEYSTSNQGDNSTSNQGDDSTSNQGDYCTSNQGIYSTCNQNNNSTSNQDNNSTSNQDNNSTSNQGYCCTSNQGYRSTSNQGDYCTSNQGYHSTNNQSYHSTNNQSDYSTSNQGDDSTSNQGKYSVAIIRGDNAIYRGGKNSICVMFYNDKRYIFESKNKTLYIENAKVLKRYSHTPQNITELKDWEVFVFGSNMAGNHSGGSAKLAYERFGAEIGIGEGLVGQSYAFPTLNRDMKQRTENKLKESIQKLIDTANANTRKIFLVTKVGCGVAKHYEEYMKSLFLEFKHKTSANIILPKNWR